MKKNILIGITLGLFLLNNNKSRNLSDATKLGWGTIYNNENPYPGKVKKDDDKDYIGLNYDLIFDGQYYSDIRKNIHRRFWNPLGAKKNIVHTKYSSKLLKLKKGDKITGIQFRIATEYKGYKGLAEPSGNRPTSTPSNFISDGYKISLGNSNNLNITKNYQFNLNQTNDLKQVKKGVNWEAEEWPFGKVPLNDFGPILKFDQDFIYQGNNLFLEINYPDKHSEDTIRTHAQGFVIDTVQTTYFSYSDNKSVWKIENTCLDIQFEVDDVFKKFEETQDLDIIIEYMKLLIDQFFDTKLDNISDQDTYEIIDFLIKKKLTDKNIIDICQKLGISFESIIKINKEDGLSEEQIKEFKKN